MRPVLEVNGLRKSFDGVPVVQDVHISVGDGEVFGLVGGNGSGKTTLLNLIGGYTLPDRGTIQLAGVDVTQWTAARRARGGLGRCFQDSRLWRDLTVREHLRIALDACRHDTTQTSRIQHYCELVELAAESRDRRPDSLRLLDRRRLELVLAASRAANLLLLDEITAGLNIEESHLICAYIKKLVHDRFVRSAIFVEHKLSLISAHATAVALMQNGQLVEKACRDDSGQFLTVINRMFSDRTGPPLLS